MTDWTKLDIFQALEVTKPTWYKNQSADEKGKMLIEIANLIGKLTNLFLPLVFNPYKLYDAMRELSNQAQSKTDDGKNFKYCQKVTCLEECFSGYIDKEGILILLLSWHDTDFKSTKSVSGRFDIGIEKL